MAVKMKRVKMGFVKRGARQIFVKRWTRQITRRPVIAIALTMVATFFLFMPLGINTWSSYVTFNTVITRDAKIQHLVDTITYVDEALTMSARMSAATGELRWQKRYFELMPKVDSAIEQINQLSNNFYEQEGTAETKAANEKLVAIETQVLSLVRDGYLAQATALINGQGYEAQKQIYTAGVQRSNQAIARETESARQRFSQSLWVSSAISSLSLAVLLPTWIGVLKITEKYLRDLKAERNKNRQLADSLECRVEQRTFELTQAMRDLKQTQSQLVQTEKMSSLGEMVAGIAHEINNPISFIQGNLPALNNYFQDLLALVRLYKKTYPQPAADIIELQADIDIDFLLIDVPKILSSMKIGTTRVRDIVLSLRNYSRLDESVVKDVDIHEGLESTLLILNHRIKQGVEVIKDYGTLPSVTCSPSQLNQVFTNIINNALDALFESDAELKQLIISTRTLNSERIQISIRDTGMGMSPEVERRIFDPFFTTKPVGKGTGLGMGICFKIIEQHQGEIAVETALSKGTAFVITLPAKPLLRSASASQQSILAA